MGRSAGAIRAGEAYVEIYGKYEPLVKDLKYAAKIVRDFGKIVEGIMESAASIAGAFEGAINGVSYAITAVGVAVTAVMGTIVAGATAAFAIVASFPAVTATFSGIADALKLVGSLLVESIANWYAVSSAMLSPAWTITIASLNVLKAGL